MARIGILTCSNATQDLDCASAYCFRDLRKRIGEFARYPKDEKIELVGIISCAGCPTMGVPEKILRKVRALAEMNVDSIHFTFCMVALCPFKHKYAELIQDAYPNINLIFGTHSGRVTPEIFQEEIRGLLCAPPQGITDLIINNPKGKQKKAVPLCQLEEDLDDEEF